MRLASLRRRSRGLSKLAPPALLFAPLAQPSCGAGGDARAVLERAFPAQAPDVLGASRSDTFADNGDGFAFEATSPLSLSLSLPARGDGAIVFGSAGVTVHEIGGAGEAHAVQR